MENMHNMEITSKTFKEGDTSKLRFFLQYLFSNLDRNLNVTLPTPFELREMEKKGGQAADRRKTMTSTKPGISGLDEEMVIQLIDFLKIPIPFNKRNFSITPQSTKNWQTAIQLFYYLVGLVKYSRERDGLEAERDLQEHDVGLFFGFLDSLYQSWLDGNETEMNTIINEWRMRFNQDSARTRETVDTMRRHHDNIVQRLNYFNTRKDPFHEMEDKRISLDQEYQRLSESITQHETALSQLVSNREILRAKIMSLQQQMDSKKRENDVFVKQIEQQTITPMEVQAIYLEKSKLEEEEDAINKRMSFISEQLETRRIQLLKLNEQINDLTNAYNTLTMNIDQNLHLMNAGGLQNNTKWKIDNVKQKKRFLKTQYKSMQEQILQLNENVLDKDITLNALRSHIEEVEEGLSQDTETLRHMDSTFNVLRQQQQEEISEFDRRIKAIEEQNLKLHIERNRWKQEAESTDRSIAQLEEEIERETQKQQEEIEFMFNMTLTTLHKVADHKSAVIKILSAPERTGIECFEGIKQLQTK